MENNNVIKLDAANFAAKSTKKANPAAEPKADRQKRMEKWFAEPKNKTIVSIGKLLACFPGVSQHLVEGRTLELPEVLTIEGVEIRPLHRTLAIKGANFLHWSCPACSSAHGSGIYPSRDKDSELLDSNEWYWNPATSEVFTISDSCKKTYFKSFQFVDLLDYKVTRKAVQPTQKGSK